MKPSPEVLHSSQRPLRSCLCELCVKSGLSSQTGRFENSSASTRFPAGRANACASAPISFVFSAGLPTEIRTASGNPIQPSGRIITPSCNSSSQSAFALGPIGQRVPTIDRATFGT